MEIRKVVKKMGVKKTRFKKMVSGKMGDKKARFKKMAVTNLVPGSQANGT